MTDGVPPVQGTEAPRGRDGSPKRLRIAYVYRAFNRSGSLASFFLDRAERLARDEDVIAVCSERERAATDAPLRFETVEAITRGSGRFAYAAECATFALRAGAALRRLRPLVDVVHVVGYAAPSADLVTVNAVRPAELAHYFDRIEPDARLRRHLAPVLRPQNLVVELVERRLFRPPYPLCIAETHAVAGDLKSRYGVPADAVDVIPAGIDLRAFRPDPEGRTWTRAARGVPDDRLVVLFVGDEFGRKGLRRAIEALARVRTDAELWVAGGGDRSEYAELAGTLGVAVVFLDRIPHEELAAVYSAADVLLLPSRQDAWGQPVLEALACGTPAIASEYTGSHEILEDGVNGFVVARDGSPEQIAEVLDGPLGDRTVRSRMAERGPETAAAFDRDRLYGKLRDAHHAAYARRIRLRHEQAGSAS